MEKYTIYCTAEQTKKARQLGAPIEIKTIEEAPKDWQGKAYFTGMATCARFPTAEQMIGWLENQCIFFSYLLEMSYISEHLTRGTRKEATLAAIDVALEYLSNLKK